MYGSGRFQQGYNNSVHKRKKGNAFLHLEKFTAVQQLALFAPDLEIQVAPYEANSPFYKATAFYRGRPVEAIQRGKKNAKQAVCSKIIKSFKLLDDHRGAGASERMDIGAQVEELAPHELTSEIPPEELVNMEVISTEDLPGIGSGQTGPLATAHGYTGNINQPLMSEVNLEKVQIEPAPVPPVTQKPTVPVQLGQTYKLAQKQGGSLPEMEKTPVSVLFETFRQGDFDIIEGIRDDSSGLFVCHIGLPDGRRFVGYGRSKKLAKHHAAAVTLAETINRTNFNLPEGCGPGGAQISSESLKLLEKPIEVGPECDKLTASTPYIEPGKVVMRINELHPGLPSTFEFSQDNGKQPLFHARIMMNGTEILGHGRSKKQAKVDLCSKMLRDIHGYSLKPPRPGQEIYCSKSITTRGRVADRFQDAVVMKFNELCQSGLDDDAHKMKVLAGICMTREPVTDESEETPLVIALGTGTKTMTGDHVSSIGTAVIDSHGEIISRRNLKRFFYSELMKVANGEGVMSIFERKVDGKFHLREGIRFHLYINTTTCGDARVFNPNSDDDFEDMNISRSSRGILRSKIENGEGTVPIKKDECVLTWDGIIGNARLKTMSCSDKVMRWNVLGLQGSLLSQLVEPIYMSSISLGGLYHRQHFPRAMFERVQDLEIEYTDGYCLHKPMMSPCSSEEPRRAKNTPAFSINWSILDDKMEKIDTSTGKCTNKENSRLCKRELFKLYLETMEKLGPVVLQGSPEYLKDIKSRTYGEAKSFATDYQKVKESLTRAMIKGDVGFWVKKPEEFESFSI